MAMCTEEVVDGGRIPDCQMLHTALWSALVISGSFAASLMHSVVMSSAPGALLFLSLDIASSVSVNVGRSIS